MGRRKYGDPKMREDSGHRTTAPIFLAAAYVTLLFASRAILSDGPRLETRVGRHLVAGALGIAALVAVEVLICLIPLRKGEIWAHWAAAVPFFVLGVPIFVMDATYGPRQTRLLTLLPQAFAIALGLILIIQAVRRQRH